MNKKILIYHATQKQKQDLFQTPPHAIFPILKYIPNNVRVIWECCDPGWSIITYILKQTGYEVISTDKLTGFDFLKHKPNFDFDMIITNPPFSLKTQFIKKCYEYQKPFALLVPLTVLEGKERFNMYNKFGINIIIFNRRINYIHNKNGAWFASIWIFWNGLSATNNNQIFFETVSDSTDNSDYATCIQKYIETKNRQYKQQNLF